LNSFGILDLKKFKKKIIKNPTLNKKFEDALTIFSKDPFDQKLKTHKLSGALKEYWAFAVDYNTRIVFKFLPNQKILLIDIGSHEEVY